MARIRTRHDQRAVQVHLIDRVMVLPARSNSGKALGRPVVLDRSAATTPGRRPRRAEYGREVHQCSHSGLSTRCGRFVTILRVSPGQVDAARSMSAGRPLKKGSPLPAAALSRCFFGGPTWESRSVPVLPTEPMSLQGAHRPTRQADPGVRPACCLVIRHRGSRGRGARELR